MKLAEHLKPGISVEISTLNGHLVLGGKGDPHRLEQVDDDEQVLHVQTTVAAGRLKGQKARLLIPYAAITGVTLPG
jgi:hypothetical protein